MNLRPLRIVASVLVSSCGASGNSPPQSPMSKAEHVSGSEDRDDGAMGSAQKSWMLYAKAALAPNNGMKLKPFKVSFRSQETVGNANVFADSIDGLEPGTYHLVIHEGENCGNNAVKAGPPWAGTSNVDIRIVIGGDLSSGLKVNQARIVLVGDAAIIGHTLVLHQNRGGKPGNAIACGPIVQTDEP